MSESVFMAYGGKLSREELALVPAGRDRNT
jgi:hypothetical protein